MIKSFKIRLYPTKEQESQFWRHIGACRYVWNYILDYQQKNYQEGGKYLSAFSMIKLLTPLKKDGEHDWLYGVSNASLQTVCRDLDQAYQAFFNKTRGYPRFKSRKRSKPSYPLRSDTIYFADRHLAHIGKVGKVKYKTDFDLPFGKDAKFTNPRISYKNGKWILSFGMKCENQAPVLTDKTMGIDLGVKELAVVSFDDDSFSIHNINKSQQMRSLTRKLKHTQRSISRKYEASKKRTGKWTKTNNILREEEKLRRLYKRISDIRNNYIHQVTHALVSMLPEKVIMEDLTAKNLMQNHKLAHDIGEECWHEFIRQMQYKCEWQGTKFVQVDKFYPSSKTCSCCGNVKRDLKLSDRIYVCPECGLKIDRDLNAAINLSRYAAY